MKLTAKCKSCKEHQVSFNSSISDRGALSFEKGKEFLVTCKNCLSKQKYHVNDFYAESSNFSKLFILLIFIAAIIGLVLIQSKFFAKGYIIIGGIIAFPFTVIQILKSQEQAKLNSFNRYKVKQ